MTGSPPTRFQQFLHWLACCHDALWAGWYKARSNRRRRSLPGGPWDDDDACVYRALCDEGRFFRLRRTVDRIAAAWCRALRFISPIRAPGWLRWIGDSIRLRIFLAGHRVAQKRQQVSRTVANSPLATGAKRLAYGGQHLEWRFAAAARSIATWTSRCLVRLVPEPLWHIGTRATRIFGAALSLVTGFSLGWLWSRRYRRLRSGIPACVLAMPLAYCLVCLPFNGQDRKAQHYRLAAHEAYAQREYATADLYFRKLQQLGVDNETVTYQAAINAIASGNEEAGVAAIRRLAPLDRAGFALAHIWLARWYLGGESGVSAAESGRLAARHLEFALEREPNSPAARALRATYLQRLGRREEAAEELRQVVQQIPQEGLSLAELLARQGRWKAAREEVAKVLRLLQQKSLDAHRLTADDYRLWSYGLRIVGETEQAEAKLDEGLRHFPDNEALCKRRSELLLAEAGRQYRQRQTTPNDIVAQLRRAWQLCDDSTDSLVLLGTIAQEDDEYGQAARAAIDEMLQADAPPPRLAAITGACYAADGQHAKAIGYLRQAIKQDPRDGYSLNNLAYCLMQTGLPSNDEALELVDRALAIEPDEPAYRETRGQLLVRMGRYRESIVDLQLALNGIANAAEIHAALATAFERLGQTEQARFHRQQSRMGT